MTVAMIVGSVMGMIRVVMHVIAVSIIVVLNIAGMVVFVQIVGKREVGVGAVTLYNSDGKETT